MVDAIALTPKEAAFVREYLACHNPAKAYIDAGYSKNGARQNAAILLRKHSIAAAIAAGEAKAAIRAQLTLDKLVATYTHLGMTGMSRFIRIDSEPYRNIRTCQAPLKPIYYEPQGLGPLRKNLRNNHAGHTRSASDGCPSNRYNEDQPQ